MKAPPTGTDLAIFLLQIDRAAVAVERDAAERGGSGLKAAFWDAHQRLADMPPQPETSKADRLAAYDARMRAGHAWHPWKTRLREAERWLKAIDRELEQITKPRKKAKFYDYPDERTGGSIQAGHDPG